MHRPAASISGRFSCWLCSGLVVVGAGAVGAMAQDGTYNTDNYYDYLPGALPKQQSIITATRASADLGLYGVNADSGYEDVNLNGIDDGREERLMSIAEAFSPVLRRNNFSVPRDFKKMLRLRFDPASGQIDWGNHELVHVDTWDLTKPHSSNRDRAAIDFDCIRSNQSGAANPVCEGPCDECLLESVLSDYNPLGPARRFVRPDSATDTIFYFDFPGSGERTWKRTYSKLARMEQASDGFDARIYAHFLVYEDPAATTDRRYRLVVQYWCFYPFNDGGNNHEGDWEHINVHITTDEVREDWMTGDEIRLMLDGRDMLDQLIIKEVDYYFHHYVLTLDFIDGAFDFYQQSISEIRELLDEMPQRENIRRWKIYRLMHDRLRLMEGCGIPWNRHPVGLIGANSRGPELLLQLPEQSNRNSHGVYPFSGIWKQVGPLGATEELDEDQAAYFRKRTKYVFPLPEPERQLVGGGDACQTSPGALLESEYKNQANDQYLTFDRDKILLVPDWERLLPLMAEHETARTEWYWLLLPIRWGFPAVMSPGAGLVKDADFGNAAPVGPPYNSAWNRPGEARGYSKYDAHHLPAIWQIEVTDNFANKLGFLNAGVLGLYLPGLNALPLLWRAYRPRRRFTQTSPPSSFIDVQSGFGVHHLDDDYARFLSEDLGLGLSGAFKNQGKRVWVRASTRLNRFESAVGFEWLGGGEVLPAQSAPVATFGMRELYGDMTLRIGGASMAPFLLGGYGYRRVKYEGDFGTRSFGWDCSVDPDVKKWIPDLAGCFKPTDWHVGAGLDWVFYKNDANAFLWHGQVPDIGLRLGYRATFERLPNNDWGTRHDFNAGLILGF